MYSSRGTYSYATETTQSFAQSPTHFSYLFLMTLCAATNTIVRMRNSYISTTQHVKEISHEKAVGSMHGEGDARKSRHNNSQASVTYLSGPRSQLEGRLFALIRFMYKGQRYRETQ